MEKERAGMTSSEWQEYLLSLMEDSEKVAVQLKNGEIEHRPRVHGLRRIFQAEVGEIIESYPTLVQPPHYSTVIHEGQPLGNPAVVMHTLIYKDKESGTLKRAGGLSDLTSKSSEAPYNHYPSAVAATRAESIAFKKAMNIYVLGFEEAYDSESKRIYSNENLPAKPQQLSIIKKVADRKNIKLDKILLGFKIKSLDSMNYEEAVQIIKYLNNM